MAIISPWAEFIRNFLFSCVYGLTIIWNIHKGSVWTRFDLKLDKWLKIVFKNYYQTIIRFLCPHVYEYLKNPYNFFGSQLMPEQDQNKCDPIN